MAIDSFKNTPFSNMTFCDVFYEGIKFRSVEHAYMAAKNPTDKDWLEYCRKTISPYEVKKASRQTKLRENWNEVKLDIMWQLLWQKFNKEPFKTALLATGDQELIEGNTWGDTFWGYDTRRKEGKNYLGFYLMEIRKHLAGIK